MTPPRELIDPEGEGVYIHNDVIPSPLLRASQLFFGTWRLWREIDQASVWMQPGRERDEWVPANIGRFPRGWRLNLPKRWTSIEMYVYCVPNPESM